MFGLFAKFSERSFKKMVRICLVQNETDWERFENSFPASSINEAYDQAWAQIGKYAINRPPNEYRIEVARAAHFVREYFDTWIELTDSCFPADGNRLGSRVQEEKNLRDFFNRQFKHVTVTFIGLPIDDDCVSDFERKLQISTFLSGAILASNLTDKESILVLKGILASFVHEIEFDVLVASVKVVSTIQKFENIRDAGFEAFIEFKNGKTGDPLDGALLFALDFSDKIKFDEISLISSSDELEFIDNIFDEFCELKVELEQTSAYPAWLLQAVILCAWLQDWYDDPYYDFETSFKKFSYFIESRPVKLLGKSEIKDRLIKFQLHLNDLCS